MGYLFGKGVQLSLLSTYMYMADMAENKTQGLVTLGKMQSLYIFLKP